MKQKKQPMEKLLKKMLDLTKVGVCIYTVGDERIVFVSKGMLDMLRVNRRPDDFEGKRMADLARCSRHKDIVAKLSARRDASSAREHHVEVPRGKGRWILFDSFIAADPLIRKKIAVIIAKDVTERREVEEEVLRLRKQLSQSRKRFKLSALRDPHTGLYNQQYLGDVMETELSRAKRLGMPFGLILVDIDFLRSVNETYGRRFGDTVLKQFAQELKRSVRRYDIVVRIAGEEFVVLSPGLHRVQMRVLAQRLMDSFALCDFGEKDRKIKLKLSIAVVAYPEDHVEKGLDLVNLAYRIMRTVKEAGGSRVFSSLDLKKSRRAAAEEEAGAADVTVLKDRLERLTKQANESVIEAIFAFAKTIELKDHYTGEHVETVIRYATEIARTLRVPDDEVERIRQASLLHDLGKIGISEKILLKKSKLTTKEFEVIKQHSQIGADIIRPIHGLQSLIPLILYHHERWDGRGYPAGLKAEEIPLGARIITVADVYDALVSNRPYRKAFPKEKAIEIIKEGAGSQFDPKIVRAFLQVLEKEK